MENGTGVIRFHTEKMQQTQIVKVFTRKLIYYGSELLSVKHLRRIFL